MWQRYQVEAQRSYHFQLADMLLYCSISNTFNLHDTDLEQQFSKLVKNAVHNQSVIFCTCMENDQVYLSLHTFTVFVFSLRKTLYAKLEISVNAQKVTGVSSQSP